MSLFPQTAKEIIEGQILLINKPLGWTSFDVVKKIRGVIKKRFKLKSIKVGHAGTLDPLATGLLILCTGKYTKNLNSLQKQKKTYTGEIILGATRPSYDLETEIESTFETSHITEDLLKTIKKEFVGKINQIPPMFSAIKKNGERLYKKARRGENIVLNSRVVHVHSFKITHFESPKISFEIKCGSGTYIRSIASDLGKALNSGAYLNKLCRVKIGAYHLKSAFDMEDLNVINP